MACAFPSKAIRGANPLSVPPGHGRFVHKPRRPNLRIRRDKIHARTLWQPLDPPYCEQAGAKRWDANHALAALPAWRIL